MAGHSLGSNMLVLFGYCVGFSFFFCSVLFVFFVLAHWFPERVYVWGNNREALQ
jgi:hypothetical protein